MRYGKRWIAVVLSILALVGCTSGGQPVTQNTTVTPVIQVEPTSGANDATTPALATDVAATPTAVPVDTPTSEPSPSPEPTDEPTPSPSPSPTAASAGRFKIDQRVTSDKEVIKPIALVLRSAEATGDKLVLRVAWEYTGEKEGYSIIGGAGGTDAVLVDASGKEYKPKYDAVDKNIQYSIAPEGGWQPGTANVGNIAFSQPGDGPYEFQFPGYPAITFTLDTPLPATTSVALQAGDFAINKTLGSREDALSKVQLRVDGMHVAGDQVRFDVAFVNTARQGYDLLLGPKGDDARLVDAEGALYKPVEVSESFKDKIAPKDGWEPGQAYSGTLTFDKPQNAETLRFVFPKYDALTLKIDVSGVVAADVTSASGGAAQPTPTAEAGDLAFAQLDGIVKAQAQALAKNDLDAYVKAFAPAIQTEQRKVVTRLQGLPVISYTLGLDPQTEINKDDAAKGTLEVPVEVSYGFKEINPDNLFEQELKYTFERKGDAWQITKVEAGDNPPFWFGGDVVIRPTEHFLLFARPTSEKQLPKFEKQAEAAYADLKARKLPVEDRYVAYFTDEQDDFTELTGKTSDRYLGVALSRYRFKGDNVTTNSRAFYINGAAFKNPRLEHDANEEQTTVTHEFTHLVLSPESRPYTPPWLAEGIAVYYSGDATQANRKRLLSSDAPSDIDLPKLTKAGSLGEFDFLGERVGYEYIFSGEAVKYLVDTFGEDKLLEFYREYASVPAADVREKMPRFGGSILADAAFADLSDKLTRDYVQKFFNVSLEQLDSDVKAAIKQ